MNVTAASLGQKDAARSATERIARSCFIVYIFFLFFGTSAPFPERTQDTEEIATSNLINQLVFTTLFLLSSGCLIIKWKNVLGFIRREKFLTLFLLWCLLSVAWSPYSFVSFKRLVQILTAVTVSLAFLFYLDTPNEVLRYFKAILYLYIPLTVLSIVLIPGAIDPDSSTWRGLATGKNQLAQIALVSSIVWFYSMRLDEKKKAKVLSFFMLAISVVLLLGAKSTTSLLALILVIAIGTTLSIDDLFKPLNIGRIFSIVFILSTIGLILLTASLAPEILSTFPEYFGKDSTFTGRTDLWADVFAETKRHWLLGWGFAGFWVIGHAPVMQLYEEYIWLPNQAHMGYLDIWNETGLIGLLLFSAVVISYFSNLLKLGKPHGWKWFILSALLISIQETTLFRQNTVTGFMFIFAYFVLHIELSRQEKAANFQSNSSI